MQVQIQPGNARCITLMGWEVVGICYCPGLNMKMRKTKQTTATQPSLFIIHIKISHDYFAVKPLDPGVGSNLWLKIYRGPILQ